MPSRSVQLINLNQKLMAPPAGPQPYLLVKQTSGWTPRSTHWFRDLFKLTAELTLKRRKKLSYWLLYIGTGIHKSNEIFSYVFSTMTLILPKLDENRIIDLIAHA